MLRKVKWSSVLIGCVFTTLAFSAILSLSNISSKQDGSSNRLFEDRNYRNSKHIDDQSTTTEVLKETDARHKMAVIVPFRDRFEELLEFLPYMKKFLVAQNVANEIMVINQGDGYRFNRASLVNVGFRLMANHCPECNYFAMHDVDLLPLNPELKYKYPADGPLHLAAPHLHPKYHYEKFVGGILLLTRSQFELVNGMSNRYWGWGLEDDEFYVRLKQANVTVQRPGNLTTDSTNTFRHIHNPRLRKRDYRHCYDQKKISLKRDYESGVNNVAFTVAGQYVITSNGASATVFNVQLECDKSFSPWCLCPEDVPKPKNATNVNNKVKKGR